MKTLLVVVVFLYVSAVSVIFDSSGRGWHLLNDPISCYLTVGGVDSPDCGAESKKCGSLAYAFGKDNSYTDFYLDSGGYREPFISVNGIYFYSCSHIL
jgi:hypothetical protein